MFLLSFFLLQLGAPRSQSVPPVLDASINGTSLTDLFINHLIPSGNTSLVAASQAARPSGTQEDSEDFCLKFHS